MKPLIVNPIQTEIFRLNGNLIQFITDSIPPDLIHEEIALCVTSKIVSLAEGQIVKKTDISKEILVRKEADHYFGEIGHGCFLTIKHGLLIPSSGIDESNSENDEYILYPKDPFKSAYNIWQSLRKIWKIEKLGILITDSHTSPLRRGVTGICLSYAGFIAVKNLVGSHDLFGRELRVTRMNLADGIAAASVMMMGEGSECRPLAIIENAQLEFTDDIDSNEIQIPLEEDLYYPLFKDIMEARPE